MPQAPLSARTLAARRARAAASAKDETAVDTNQVDSSLTEQEHRLNKMMKCPYGRNKVYIRSLLTAGAQDTSEPEIALRCAVMAYVGQAAGGFNVVTQDYIERYCCGDYKRCKAYQEFRKRKRR